MVRMSDLVRGPAAGPPLPALDEEDAPEPGSSAAAPAPARPAGLTLRTIESAPGAASAVPRREEATPAAAPARPAGPPAPPPRREAPDTPRSVFEALHALLAGVRDAVLASRTPAWTEIESLLGRVVVSLERSGELFWLANAPVAPAGLDYLVAHQSRVAVLAARIGLTVGYDRERAIPLGIAGALLDVGLWLAPSGLMRRLGSLTADEQAAYRAHPQRSATLLAQWGAPRTLVEAVLHHHEREQGQGFPQGLAGNAISQDAKILGLVDAYAGLTLPAARRPALRPHEAIREIVRSKHESFSPALIKALLSEISVFPPGTLVRLNTGEVGQVTAVNRSHPLRPRVEVVADAKGNRPVTAKAIDLSETPFLYITGPVSDSTT